MGSQFIEWDLKFIDWDIDWYHTLIDLDLRLVELDLKSIRSLLNEGDFVLLGEWDPDLLRLIEIKDWLNKIRNWFIERDDRLIEWDLSDCSSFSLILIDAL